MCFILDTSHYNVDHRTYPNDSFSTFRTSRGEVLPVVGFTEELTLFLHKSTVNQGTTAVRVRAVEMVRTPTPVQGKDEWSPTDIYRYTALVV